MKYYFPFLYGLAESEITTLRIGTKDYPSFHRVSTSPFSIEMDDKQQYINPDLKVFTFQMDERNATSCSRAKKRAHFISLENQTPIILKKGLSGMEKYARLVRSTEHEIIGLRNDKTIFRVYRDPNKLSLRKVSLFVKVIQSLLDY
ncbi:2503_t:CDS:2 [Ambispora leptoticha]|uniref:2503_t:CDS:1 n=1 Tax=Ambispora leptoticha TaxID=144679 RepID=A0A9N9G5V5_9GLOM|nr:2503_t:CDS:2 [Ambispora leptoticha]